MYSNLIWSYQNLEQSEKSGGVFRLYYTAYQCHTNTGVINNTNEVQAAAIVLPESYTWLKQSHR